MQCSKPGLSIVIFFLFSSSLWSIYLDYLARLNVLFFLKQSINTNTNYAMFNLHRGFGVKNFKSRQITSYMYILTLKFGYHLPLDSEVFHHLNKLKFPSYKASLCQVYTDLMALRFCRINLTSRQNIFTISLLHPLLRKRIRAT